MQYNIYSISIYTLEVTGSHFAIFEIFEKIKPPLLIITPCLLSTFTEYTLQKGRLLKQNC